jgi:hypothetical protein
MTDQKVRGDFPTNIEQTAPPVYRASPIKRARATKAELTNRSEAHNTRWQRKPRTFSSVEDALRDTAAFYRKSPRPDADAYVEIWLKKDALAGVIYPITSMYDVPLLAARGYASLSFLYGAAEYIKSLVVPAYIYHLGDFDPSGVNAGEKFEETLRQLAPDADIVFELEYLRFSRHEGGLTNAAESICGRGAGWRRAVFQLYDRTGRRLVVGL